MSSNKHAMTSPPLFRCSVCQQPAENPYLCLDRRIERASILTHEGKTVNALMIAVCQSLFIYCSHQCWQTHRPLVAAELRLQSAYPAFGFITPCSRCGEAVNRTLHYVNYSIAEMRLTGIEPFLTGQCVDDHDFAVLCRACEDPGWSAAEAQSATANELEGVTA